jgi:hypothetical protein
LNSPYAKISEDSEAQAHALEVAVELSAFYKSRLEAGELKGEVQHLIC